MGAPMNVEAIQAVLASERFLDSPVTEYLPKSIGVKFDLGAASTLREYYKKNLLDVPGRIVVGNTEITTTPEVMAALRAILHTGCCRIEDRSVACREVFTRACQVGTNIGAEELLSTFVSESDNPFVKVIQDTIKELLEAY